MIPLPPERPLLKAFTESNTQAQGIARAVEPGKKKGRLFHNQAAVQLSKVGPQFKVAAERPTRGSDEGAVTAPAVRRPAVLRPRLLS